MKIFETAGDIVELAEHEFGNTNLYQMGINLKIMSVTKAKDILKVSRANATTEFITKKSDMITLFVYEDAFDRLSDEYKEILMEGAFSNVSYDMEKEKLNLDNSRYGEFIRMRKKYPQYGDIIEAGDIVMAEIIEEEKQRKEEEKQRKAASKKMNKNK